MTTAQCQVKGRLLCVTGEMTIYQIRKLKDEIFSLLASPEISEFDLSEVTEFDSSGFQLIALARREAGYRGRPLTVRNCSPAVKKVLDAYAVADWMSAKPAKGVKRGAAKKGE